VWRGALISSRTSRKSCLLLQNLRLAQLAQSVVLRDEGRGFEIDLSLEKIDFFIDRQSVARNTANCLSRSLPALNRISTDSTVKCKWL